MTPRERAEGVLESLRAGPGIAPGSTEAMLVAVAHDVIELDEALDAATEAPLEKYCPHSELGFLGKNAGMYCRACGVTWERERLRPFGSTLNLQKSHEASITPTGPQGPGISGVVPSLGDSGQLSLGHEFVSGPVASWGIGCLICKQPEEDHK